MRLCLIITALLAVATGCTPAETSKKTVEAASDAPTKKSVKATKTAVAAEKPVTKAPSPKPRRTNSVMRHASAKSVADALMQSMTRRDIETAMALFPSNDLLEKQFPGAACATFRAKVLDNRNTILKHSREWVHESIARLRFGESWKAKLDQVTDGMVPRIRLTVLGHTETKSPTESVLPEVSACAAAKGVQRLHVKTRFQGHYQELAGPLTLDSDVMSIGGRWVVIGY
jgi:hypothetical protein